MTSRRPVEAITKQRTTADQNRRKIADALVAAQHDGIRVNVTAIAAKAGVDPGTIRNNPDLLAEVVRIRDEQAKRPPAAHAAESDAATYKEMQARWLGAQHEVTDLRTELKKARNTAHQALGISTTLIDPDELRQAHTRMAELEVQLINTTQAKIEVANQLRDLSDQLTDCHELNRNYLRQLDEAKRDLQAEKQKRATRTLNNRPA